MTSFSPENSSSSSSNPCRVIENILTPKECREYIRWINTDIVKGKDVKKQGIEFFPSITKQIWPRVQPLLPPEYEGMQLIGISDDVSISRHKTHLNIHQDVKRTPVVDGKILSNCVCLFKMAIYLNDLSDSNNPDDVQGGTSFYDSEGKELVQAVKPRVGALIIFHIREWHSGTPFDVGDSGDKRKYMLGFRALYK